MGKRTEMVREKEKRRKEMRKGTRMVREIEKMERGGREEQRGKKMKIKNKKGRVSVRQRSGEIKRKIERREGDSERERSSENGVQKESKSI